MRDLKVICAQYKGDSMTLKLDASACEVCVVFEGLGGAIVKSVFLNERKLERTIEWLQRALACVRSGKDVEDAEVV